ncbi:MAG: hypothetical protein ABI211_11330 [Vicinamibacterales bacterium]
MTITLELPPELEARFVAEAKAKGVSVVEVVKAHLSHVPQVYSARHLSAADIETGLDEAADLIPAGLPPFSDEALSRESIYTREDDWNR